MAYQPRRCSRDTSSICALIYLEFHQPWCRHLKGNDRMLVTPIACDGVGHCYLQYQQQLLLYGCTCSFDGVQQGLHTCMHLCQSQHVVRTDPGHRKQGKLHKIHSPQLLSINPLKMAAKWVYNMTRPHATASLDWSVGLSHDQAAYDSLAWLAWPLSRVTWTHVPGCQMWEFPLLFRYENKTFILWMSHSNTWEFH